MVKSLSVCVLTHQRQAMTLQDQLLRLPIDLWWRFEGVGVHLFKKSFVNRIQDRCQAELCKTNPEIKPLKLTQERNTRQILGQIVQLGKKAKQILLVWKGIRKTLFFFTKICKAQVSKAENNTRFLEHCPVYRQD